MRLNKHYLKTALTLLATTVISLLPFLLNPSAFLNANNDLNNFFKPLLIYVKNTILTKGQIPLWNDLWFGGMPLVSDPQSPLSYPFNLIFLFGDINKMLILTIILHSFFATVFFYKLSRTLKLDQKSSIFASLLYVGSTRYIAALTAGHLGILYIWTWIPLFLLLVYKATKKASALTLSLLSISTALLVVTHLPTAIIVIGFGGLTGLLATNTRRIYILQTTLSFILAFMLVSPFLLPNFIWQRETTRNLLLIKPAIYPVWNGKIDFIKSLILTSKNFDTEKAIAIGVVPLILVLLTFKKLKFKKRLLLITLFGLVFVISGSNVSPIYPLLLKINFFELLRVMTRFWIVIAITVPLLCAFYLNGRKGKKVFLVFILAACNILLLGNSITRHLNSEAKFVSPDVYADVRNSDGKVYTDSQVFDPYVLAKQGTLSINGYATLIPHNFFVKSWGLFGGYWDYYTLALPPFGASRFQKLNPDLKALGEYNVATIVSQKGDGFSVSKNPYNLGLSYNTNNGVEDAVPLPVMTNTPNIVRVDTKDIKYPYVVLARGFTAGMSATTDTGVALDVMENPSSLFEVRVPENTRYVSFVFEPPLFRLGLILLTIALIIILLILFNRSLKIKLFQKIYLSLLSILVTLVVTEAATRVFQNIKQTRTTLTWTDNPIVGRRLNPNQSGLFISNTYEYKTKIDVNSNGFRDTDHNLNKEPGTLRILLLGDSFVENFQVPMDKTIFKLLEKNLTEKLHKKVEVIALGLGDTGTGQQYLLLKYYGTEYKPDVVVHLFFSGNDIKNNSRVLMGDPYRPYFELIDDNLVQDKFSVRSDNFKYSTLSFFKNRSRLVELVLDAKGKLVNRSNSLPVDYEVYKKDVNETWRNAWNVTSALITETKKLSNENESKYILVDLANNEQVNLETKQGLVKRFPVLATEEFDFTLPDQKLNTICVENKTDCYFMLPFFEDYIKNNSNTVTHFKYDGHLNEVGTNLAATFLTNTLLNYLKIK